MKLFENLDKRHYLLLAGWLLINIIQSVFTELHADESYYWLYSQHLAWGFFDHPPMDAILIHLGYSILHKELGVRLFVLLVSTATVALVMNELDEKKDLFFLSLFLLSFPLMHTHIGGFLALPDVPLVFFTVLFFLTYRRFVVEPNLKLSLLLGFLGAAMIFSKYHAFLVLGLVILSNLKLLRNKYFWLTLIVAVLLLSPHIWWQVENHFPTFRYHLHDRAKPFQFKYVFDNLLNQLVIMGPLTGVLIFYSLHRYKTKHDLYRRAIIFNVLGFYAVFFILSFWNRIEAHWTTAITPLLIIASYPIISHDPVLKKWFKRLALPVVVLFFAFRFYLAADFIPNVGAVKLGFYNREATSKQIQKLAKGRKVAFFDNFASPGMYEFYTGEKCIALATPGYRYCQFDLWNSQDCGDGDTLFVVIPDRMDPTDLFTLANGKRVKVVTSPDFQTIRHMNVEVDNFHKQAGYWEIDVTLDNQSGKTIYLNHPSDPALGYLQDGKEIDRTSLYDITKQDSVMNGENLHVKYKIPEGKVDPEQKLTIFTQTHDLNRGEMATIHLE